MDSQIKVFENNEFGAVRTERDMLGNVLFCGADVAKALGYAHLSEAVSAHCTHTVKCRIGGRQVLKQTEQLRCKTLKYLSFQM